MKSLALTLSGLVFCSTITTLPTHALEIPTVCEALDPRETDFVELREAAIATAKQQHEAGQINAAGQTLQNLLIQLQDGYALQQADSAVDHYLAIAEAAIDLQQIETAFQWQ